MTSLAERFAELRGTYEEDVERPWKKWPYFAAAGLAVAVGVGAYFLGRESSEAPEVPEAVTEHIKEMEGRIEERDTAIAELKKVLEDYETQDPGSRIKELEGEIYRLKGGYKQLEGSIEGERNKREELEKGHAERLRKLKDGNEKLSRKYGKLEKEKDEELESLRTELEEYRTAAAEKKAGKKTILQTKDFMKDAYSHFKLKWRRELSSENWDDCYDETVKYMEQYKELEPDINEVCSNLDRNDENYGLFLSAMLNVTKLETVSLDRGEMNCIGYRIAKGKTLIIGRDAKAKNVGAYGRGVVLNFGEVENMAEKAQGGFQGNWGEVRNMSEKAKWGFQGNWGRAHNMAEWAEGGFQGNWGEVGYKGRSSHLGGLGENAHGGFQGNWGRTIRLGLNAGGGFQGNWGKMGYIVNENTTTKEVEQLAQELAKRIEEVEFLKTADSLTPNSQEDIAKICLYDFDAFTKDVIILAQKIVRKGNQQ